MYTSVQVCHRKMWRLCSRMIAKVSEWECVACASHQDVDATQCTDRLQSAATRQMLFCVNLLQIVPN